MWFDANKIYTSMWWRISWRVWSRDWLKKRENVFTKRRRSNFFYPIWMGIYEIFHENASPMPNPTTYVLLENIKLRILSEREVVFVLLFFAIYDINPLIYSHSWFLIIIVTTLPFLGLHILQTSHNSMQLVFHFHVHKLCYWSCIDNETTQVVVEVLLVELGNNQ